MCIESTSGLFSCTQCGRCCHGYGGTYVSNSDIAAIAGFLGIEANLFFAKYCTLSGQRPVLAQRADGYCAFWDGNCRIHPVKPRMCRDWPFISSLLVDIGNWAVMADSCPGINRKAAPEDVRAAVRRQQNPSAALPRTLRHA